MPDETQVPANAPAGKAAMPTQPPVAAPAAKIVLAAKPVVYTPMAEHITQRPADKMVSALNNLKPLGNPHPGALEAVKAAALALIAICKDADNVEVKMEISGGVTGHQIMAMVIPHKFD